MQQKRRTFEEQGAKLDPDRVVYIDEFGFNISMRRMHARALEGERAVGYVPFNHDPQMTLILGLRRRGIVAPILFKGALNGVGFDSYVEQALLPELRPGDVVIADGVSSHRSLGAKALIEAHGAELRILPPYSPDMNPVEEAGSKVKNDVRNQEPENEAEILADVGKALHHVTASDAQGWFGDRAAYLGDSS